MRWGSKTQDAWEGRDAAGVRFLFTELQIGMTFANLAISAGMEGFERTAHYASVARKAYDTILRFEQRVWLSEKEVRELEKGKRALETVLRELRRTES